jgi:hypothetical protein
VGDVKSKKDDLVTRKIKAGHKASEKEEENPRETKSTEYLFGLTNWYLWQGTARQVGTAFLTINTVIDLALFSSSFVVGSF